MYAKKFKSVLYAYWKGPFTADLGSFYPWLATYMFNFDSAPWPPLALELAGQYCLTGGPYSTRCLLRPTGKDSHFR